MQVDNNLPNKSKTKKRRMSRNVRIRQREKRTQAEAKAEKKVQTSDTAIVDTTSTPDKSAPLLENTQPNIEQKTQTLDASKQKNISKVDDFEQQQETLKRKKEDKEQSIREQRQQARKKRRKRHAARRQKLLEQAIDKIQDQTGDADSLIALKEQVNPEKSNQSSVQTNLSQKDLVNNAGASDATSKKTNFARDRFKNALKALNKNKDDETPLAPEHKDYLKAEEFKSKINEQKRRRQIANDFLSDLGAKLDQSNIKALANAIADQLHINIEQTLPKYSKSVTQLQKRSLRPVRSGKGNKINEKKTKQNIVGNLFSKFSIIDQDDDFIRINNLQENLYIPDNNIDEIRDGLLSDLLFKSSKSFNSPPVKQKKQQNITNNIPYNTQENTPIKPTTPSQLIKINQQNKAQAAPAKPQNFESNSLQKLLEKKISLRADSHQINILKSRLKTSLDKYIIK